MKEKNLIVLFVILAVLIGLVFVKKTLEKDVPMTEEIIDIIAPSVSAEAVNEIVLMLGNGRNDDDAAADEGGGDEKEEEDKGQGTGGEEAQAVVRLVREGDRWKDITRYGVYANEKTISSALDKLDQLKGELRSNKADILEDFGIEEAQAFNIQLRRSDGQAVHILVGMKKAGYQNNFVRLQGANAVYLVNEDLLATFGVRGEGDGQSLDTKQWADQRIAHMEVDHVVGVSISQTVDGRQEQVIKLRQATVDDQKKWQSAIPYDFTLDATKIKKIAENLNNIYARDVIAPDTQGVYDSPGWVGTFTLEDGETVQIVRGAKDSDGQNYYVKQEGAAYHFLVPVSSFDSREKQQGDIFVNNPLHLEENTVQSIMVEDLNGKKEFFAVKKRPSPTEGVSSEGKADDQTSSPEEIWESSTGENVNIAKIRDIINQIKAFNLETVPPPAVSLSNVMTLSLTGEGEAQKYMISKDFKWENGKECHILKVSGGAQGYCISKSQVTALQNALP
jgi:hypothetical protein